MRLTKIEGHTFDLSLLDGGWVLDGGCLDFRFSNALIGLGATVLAVDPSPAIADPKIARLTFRQVALVAYPIDSAQYAITSCAEGNYLCDDKRGGRLAVVPVACRTVSQLMGDHAIAAFDLVKLDIEGSEYDVLKHWPGPIARQISVEFHDFQKINPCVDPALFYEELLDVLGRWYAPVHWPAHRCDCLLALRRAYGK